MMTRRKLLIQKQSQVIKQILCVRKASLAPLLGFKYVSWFFSQLEVERS